MFFHMGIDVTPKLQLMLIWKPACSDNFFELPKGVCETFQNYGWNKINSSIFILKYFSIILI